MHSFFYILFSDLVISSKLPFWIERLQFNPSLTCLPRLCDSYSLQPRPAAALIHLSPQSTLRKPCHVILNSLHLLGPR